MAELFATFGINWKLLIIQAVNFGVLLAALSYFLYTPILRLLDERKKHIEKGVKDATDAAEKLLHASEESGRIIGGAAKDAEGIIAHAREHAVSRGAEIEAHAKERAEGILKEAAERGEALKDSAIRESEAAIAKAAVLAAEKILASGK